MRNQNIDQCWQFQHGLYDEFPDAEKAKSIREVNLPHDYMIESKSAKAPLPVLPAAIIHKVLLITQN